MITKKAVEYNERLNREVKQKLEKVRKEKTSYMSNAKWRKLLEELEGNTFCLREGRIKTLCDEKTYPFDMNIGVLETGEHTGDGICGPVAFKDIEWIFIPVSTEYEEFRNGIKYRTTISQNNLEEFKNFIDKLGKFEYDFDKDGLKIYGYK
jgi:hypothetical protein